MGDEGGWWTVNEGRLGGVPILRWVGDCIAVAQPPSVYENRKGDRVYGACTASLEESVSVCCRLQTTADRLHTMAGELRRRRGVRMGKRCVFASRWSRDRNPLFGPTGPQRLSDFSANSIYFAINRRSKDMPVTVVRHGFNALDLEHKEGPGERHSRWGRVWAR